jgi:hypothetical protein
MLVGFFIIKPIIKGNVQKMIHQTAALDCLIIKEESPKSIIIRRHRSIPSRQPP